MHRAEPIPGMPPREDPERVSTVTVEGVAFVRFSFDVAVTRNTLRDIKRQPHDYLWDLATLKQPDIMPERRSVEFVGLDSLDVSDWGVSID